MPQSFKKFSFMLSLKLVDIVPWQMEHVFYLVMEIWPKAERDIAATLVPVSSKTGAFDLNESTRRKRDGRLEFRVVPRLSTVSRYRCQEDFMQAKNRAILRPLIVKAETTIQCLDWREVYED